MLRPEENEFISRVGPGTPMGELLRRFWTPALLSEELPASDCPPVRVRLLGEDLVAFRDTQGKVGLLAAFCPHRRADLFFGRNEEGGLRCVYHGWKYDVEGNCVDMPNEPAESNFKHKVHNTAYRAQEQGGVIWAYMGPKELMPKMPELEWTRVPDSHRYLTKQFQECNYLQALEGDLDSSHASFLHATSDRTAIMARLETGVRRPYWMGDGAPRFAIKDTDYGLLIGARRDTGEDTYYWRLTQWLLPGHALIPMETGSPIACNAWVPMDDEHTCVFRIMYHCDRPLTASELRENRHGGEIYAELIPGTWRPVRNKDNDWLIDRALQRSHSFTGIKGLNEQDQSMTVGMGPLLDRSKEHLGTTDAAIIATRRKLLRLARNLQEGIEPYAAYHGEAYRVRPAALILKRGEPFDEGAKELLAARA